MAEFTGERVIPGEVDPDLLNEHVARYLFAARMAKGRRVLDAGCGAGYGAAALGREAREVVGIDIAQEAIDYAREHYAGPRVRFECASCLEIPAPDGAYDLVAAFEIIEHVSDWRRLLREARRVLRPEGHLIISTPNKLYYAESRAQHGPNPFHVHEFESEEFRSELAAVFPHVTLYAENHTDAISFAPVLGSAAVEARVEQRAVNAAESHFLVAVASVAAEMPPPGFVYVPSAANMLREREHHIELLEGWLEKSKAELRDLMEQFGRQSAELDESNRWAETLDAQLHERDARVAALQEELASEQGKARARIDELEQHEAQLAKDLEGQVRELAQAVEQLHSTERTLEELTARAERALADVDELRQQVKLYEISRWVRLGRQLGLGPKAERGK